MKREPDDVETAEDESYDEGYEDGFNDGYTQALEDCGCDDAEEDEE